LKIEELNSVLDRIKAVVLVKPAQGWVRLLMLEKKYQEMYKHSGHYFTTLLMNSKDPVRSSER